MSVSVPRLYTLVLCEMFSRVVAPSPEDIEREHVAFVAYTNAIDVLWELSNNSAKCQYKLFNLRVYDQENSFSLESKKEIDAANALMAYRKRRAEMELMEANAMFTLEHYRLDQVRKTWRRARMYKEWSTWNTFGMKWRAAA